MRDIILLAYYHFKIYHRLFALGLELPEETLVDLHGFDAVGESYGIHEAIITSMSFLLTSYLLPLSPFHEIVRHLTFNLFLNG